MSNNNSSPSPSSTSSSKSMEEDAVPCEDDLQEPDGKASSPGITKVKLPSSSSSTAAAAAVVGGKMKSGSSTGFSIQSILARPEPIRPIAEHVFSAYGQQLLHYQSLAAAFFPLHNKMQLQHGNNHHVNMPIMFGSSCWQSQLPSNNNDLPENLSIKSSSLHNNHGSNSSLFRVGGASVKLDPTVIPSSENEAVGQNMTLLMSKKEENNMMKSIHNHHHASMNNTISRKITTAKRGADNHNNNILTLVNPDHLQHGGDDSSLLQHSSPSSPFSTDEGGDGGGKLSPGLSESPSGGSHSHRRKKTRTVFSRSQVFQLESTFDIKRYLSSADRAALAASLNLSEQQIKIWFQNRRNKWKRQISSDTDSAIISAGQMHAAAAAAAAASGRFQSGHPGFMYPFPAGGGGGGGNMPTGADVGSLFCPGGAMHQYMTGHLPFPRSSV